MPDIKKSVGIGGDNLVHDVALVQAMLKVIKNPKGVAYLASNYDGSYGNDTKNAIIAFQTDNKLIAADPAPAPAKGGAPAKTAVPAAVPAKTAPPPPPVAGLDTKGLVTTDGQTIKQLNAKLTAPYDTMRIIEGMKTVYIAGDAADATTSRHAITTHPQIDATFRTNVASLVRLMFERHGIVLWLTPTGSRRTFADQAAEVNTKAGPGESNHNFGRAVDIGFKHFRWVQGDGSIKKDADWLNTLEKAKAAQANAFWDTRDAIALNELGLFRLQFERVHLQAHNDATVSMVKSLATLLTAVGTMKWEAAYKTDLGLGKAIYNVGTAKTIWAGTATVTKAMAAAVLSSKDGKAVAEKDVKENDLKDLQVALKKEFETADANWTKWTGVGP